MYTQMTSLQKGYHHNIQNTSLIDPIVVVMLKIKCFFGNGDPGTR